jgi:hypothetical protein
MGFLKVYPLYDQNLGIVEAGTVARVPRRMSFLGVMPLF